ncbi:MAG TPA: ABC transporter [Ruminococcaceae bacterium]|nr:ABC transporter [Oscillospiraceae bacterium]
MSAVFKRELRSYFTSPLAYVVLAVLYLFSGMFFSTLFREGSPQISYVFSNMFVIILFVIPVLTMRLFSEEKRQKTDQALFTAPVKLGNIVLGKFFAAFLVFVMGLLIAVAGQMIITVFVAPDWTIFTANLLGVLLLGAALIAVGLFVSCLTESQVVAAVCSFAVSLFLLLLDTMAEMLNSDAVSTVTGWISFNGRYGAFMHGILDYSNAIFFLSIAALFLFLSARVLEKRRWS